ncbi:hypothetical protein ACE4RV_03605, partial [Acetobacter persici]|uniref:hypothetical protein n=1 Tax=Acetobacter persici TaxID=1076596 RepID=UPI0036DE0B69
IERCNHGEFSFPIAYKILSGHLNLTFSTQSTQNGANSTACRRIFCSASSDMSGRYVPKMTVMKALTSKIAHDAESVCYDDSASDEAGKSKLTSNEPDH